MREKMDFHQIVSPNMTVLYATFESDIRFGALAYAYFKIQTS